MTYWHGTIRSLSSERVFATVTAYQIRSDRLAWREVADEAVILDLETAEYLTLNPTGAVLWDSLASGPATIADLVERLVSEFEVSPDAATTDVEGFVAVCMERNLLQTADSQTA